MRHFSDARDKLRGLLRRISPQAAFLVIGGCFGLALMVANPLFHTPDDIRHFWRAYQISEGTVLPVRDGNTLGGPLPRSIVSLLDHAANTPRDDPASITLFSDFRHPASHPPDPTSRQFANFANTALYSPVAYAGPSAFIFMGRLFDASPIALAYLGRLANLVCWLTLAYLAIRIIPVGKYFLLVLALSPVAMQQAASLSADVTTNGAALVLVAMIVAVCYHRTLDKGWLIAMTSLSVVLGLCKQPFFLLPLLGLIIPTVKFGSVRRRIAILSAVIGAGTLATVLWSIPLNDLFVPYRTNIVIEPMKQLVFVMTHPHHFLLAMVRTYEEQGWWLIRDAMGALGIHNQIKLPAWSVALTYAGLLAGLALGLPAGFKKFSRYSLLITLGLIIALFTAINLLIYMSWTPYRGESIAGMQGRYFLPLFGLAVCFVWSVKHEARKYLVALCYTSILTACYLTVSTLVST